MNVFIAIAALMTLLVVAWLVYPLLRPKPGSGISTARLNTDIHRDQLRALEADLARGVISQQDFEATRDELQLRLLDDTESYEAAPATDSRSFWSARKTAILIGLATPVVALGIYLQLGTPAAIDPVAAAKEGDQQVRKMVDALAEQLKAKPDNPTGWAMLARSYKVMGRFDEAEQAFINAGELVNTEPALLVDYADLLAVKANNNIEGRPLEMVNKALVINPRHPMGLMMAGVAAFRRADYKLAIVQWEKLLAELEPGSPDAEQVQANINDAKAKAGMPVAASAATAVTGPETGKLPPVPAAAAVGMTPEMINQMVERLASRQKANPNDLKGWAKLGRAYKVQGRLDEAEQAYAKTGKLLDADADLLAQYADLLATRSNGDFKGKPAQLIANGLKLNPKHPMLLMMAGQAALQRMDYVGAIKHWETVLTVLPPDSPDAEQVKAEMANARTKMK